MNFSGRPVNDHSGAKTISDLTGRGAAWSRWPGRGLLALVAAVMFASALPSREVLAATIAAGGVQSCASTTEYGLKCWGRQYSGSVGNGQSTSCSINGQACYSPVDVFGLEAGSHPIAVAAGTEFTCAIAAAGVARCWGYNNRGQVGDGTTTTRFSPADVAGLGLGVTSIATGDAHGCAVTAAGAAKCWGFNTSGQLGDGTLVNRPTAVSVSGFGSAVVTQVAVGYGHSCGLTSAGGVKCWGDNAAGQLGDGTLVAHQTAADVQGLTSGVSAIAAGGNQTCARLSTGGVKCWGDNTYGQLGDGTTVSRSMPTSVAGLDSGVAAVTVGRYHTCVRTTAGAARCWGNNSHSEIGDGTTNQRTTSVPVSGLASGVFEIAAGDSHTCARLANGAVRCWGAIRDGRVGDGSRSTNSNALMPTPVDVAGLTSDVSLIASGAFHTCVRIADGSAMCWGEGGDGELGTGGTADRSAAKPVTGLAGVTDLAGGYYHTCALTSSGGVKCWGANNFNQIGDGSATNRTSPQDVLGAATGITALATGGYHSCARTSAGAARCWGRNNAGQLGDNTTTNRPNSVVVSGISGVQSVAAGGSHSCAVTTTGAAWCWGDNTYGQLGDGTLAPRHVPVAVTGLGSGVASIDAGDNHTCARMTSGAINCWGRNNRGQLGDASGTDQSQPVPVVGYTLSGAAATTVGNEHTCALNMSGGLQCWGYNNRGQIGNGTLNNGAVPQNVSGLTSGVAKVSAGGYHTCAITTSGTAKCWGQNEEMQLGDSTYSDRYTPTDVARWLLDNDRIFRSGFEGN